MRYSILRLPHSSARWDLVVQFLKLRTEVFVDGMDWALNVVDGMEFEQYDSIGATTYIVAHDGDNVRGGARLLRCDNSIGRPNEQVSYMIRDAFLERINLPSNLCETEPPTDPKSWELTRLVSVNNDAKTAHDILEAANAFIKMEGGERCLFLGPPAFMRMAKSYGYRPEPLGPVVGNQDGRFLAFSCDVV